MTFDDLFPYGICLIPIVLANAAAWLRSHRCIDPACRRCRPTISHETAQKIIASGATQEKLTAALVLENPDWTKLDPKPPAALYGDARLHAHAWPASGAKIARDMEAVRQDVERARLEQEGMMAIKFDDNRDEAAWIQFAAGHRMRVNSAHGSNEEVAHAARFADRMLEELKKRRNAPTGLREPQGGWRDGGSQSLGDPTVGWHPADDETL